MAPVWVEHTTEWHLLALRHRGYGGLGIGHTSIEPWKLLREFATAAGIPHDFGRLVGITHDDPYVVNEDQIRFDAALLISGPIDPPRPFTYRTMPSQLCVVHRHTGGAEQIAKTFAAIGVQWMPSEGWRLRCASPLEVHHVDRAFAAAISHTDAYVPLEHPRHPQPEGAP